MALLITSIVQHFYFLIENHLGGEILVRQPGCWKSFVQYPTGLCQSNGLFPWRWRMDLFPSRYKQHAYDERG